MLPNSCPPPPVGATLLLPFPFFEPKVPAVTFGGGDGSSFETAVIVRAPDGAEGVRAEYAWLARHFPGSRPWRQSLRNRGERSYDVVEFHDADGTKRELWFDITAFFGR
jgi:hypothetical protein